MGLMRAARVLFLLLIILLWLPTALSPLTVDLRWVEIHVSLMQDGMAEITYITDWNISRGTMSGFYFEGFAKHPRFNREKSYLLFNDTRYPLNIKAETATKYDVYSDTRVGPGTAKFLVNFHVNLLAEGNVGLTHSADHGELVYFNWAPARWEYPMEHQTVYVYTLRQVEKTEFTFSQVKESGWIFTEPFMNERYRMDYFGKSGRERPSSRF